MLDVIKGAGLLIYPLLLCSIVAVYIICERLYSLRQGAVLPDDLVDGKPRPMEPSAGIPVGLAGRGGEVGDRQIRAVDERQRQEIECGQRRQGFPHGA